MSLKPSICEWAWGLLHTFHLLSNFASAQAPFSYLFCAPHPLTKSCQSLTSTRFCNRRAKETAAERCCSPSHRCCLHFFSPPLLSWLSRLTSMSTAHLFLLTREKRRASIGSRLKRTSAALSLTLLHCLILLDYRQPMDSAGGRHS